MALRIEEIFPERKQEDLKLQLEKQLLSLLTQKNPEQAFLRFMMAYAKYNSNFPGAICSLVAAITRFSGLDRLEVLQDHRHQVAACVFEAARDEFAGETHRGLALKTLRGMLDFFQVKFTTSAPWLDPISQVIRAAYEPVNYSPKALFYSLGFHLASEFYASFEFSILDIFMDERLSELRKHLVDNRCYHWITAHSCFGEDVEFAHYQSAIKGIELTQEYLPTLEWVKHVRAGADKFDEQWSLFVKWAGK